MKYTRKADGTIVDEAGNPVSQEDLIKAGINIEGETPAPTVESLQNELMQLKRENLLLTKKAAAIDDLMVDPRFQKWAYSINQKQEGVTQPPTAQSTPQPPGDRFADFEDGPGLEKLVTTIVNDSLEAFRNRILPELDRRSAERFEPLMQNLAQNRQEADFQALVGQAQQGGWELDPNTIRKEIDFERQKIPNLTMNQAYDLVKANLERGNLITRKPVIPQEQSGQNISDAGQQGNPLIQPASGGGTVPLTGSSNRFDEAVKEKVEGKGDAVRRPSDDIIMEAARQVGIDYNDL